MALFTKKKFFVEFTFLYRAWQGDEIASVHVSNIVGKMYCVIIIITIMWGMVG